MCVNLLNPRSSADEIKDKTTPAVVSLAAGGIAGGVESFLSVR